MGYEDPTVIANQLFDATLFAIVGPIHVNYSSSSITGVPLVSYKDSELDLNFQGDDITRVQTSLGELVTVTLQTVPDAFTRTFTLIVPPIRVPPGGQAEFDTLGIETTDRSGAFVPPPGPAGVLQTYQVHQLHGNAQHATF
jgi:hypothetical protein